MGRERTPRHPPVGTAFFYAYLPRCPRYTGRAHVGSSPVRACPDTPDLRRKRRTRYATTWRAQQRNVNGSATHAERQRERWERHTWRRSANGARCEQDARKRGMHGVRGANGARHMQHALAFCAMRVAPRATCLAVRHVPCAARTGFLHYARCVRSFCTMRATVSAKPTATSAAVTT